MLGQDLMVGQNLMVGHVLLGGKSEHSYLTMKTVREMFVSLTTMLINHIGASIIDICV